MYTIVEARCTVLHVWSYRSRGLERRLPDVQESVKVVVLEGARAVGKTRLVRQLVEQGRFRSYSDLSQPTTRAAAAADLEGWLTSLAAPAVIDEAQLVPELPLAVKRIVDSRPPTLQFVLTGSASIGREGLGGADPLAGRADRFVLRTFTESERAGLRVADPSVVDVLFDWEPDVGRRTEAVDEAELLERIERGGLPEFALGTSDRERRSLRIRDDVMNALSRELVPEERFDAGRVRDVLDAVVRAPGRVINDSTLGKALGLDRRTVDRYLAILERRFLLLRLPNLALNPTSQAGHGAKAHAFDVAIAAESLRRAGVDLATSREVFGQLLESWVVQQLTSAASWASASVDIFHWRNSRPAAEVDLVLVDDRGRHIGVEVKAARELRASDAKGLRALAAARGLDRGFIVYLGDTVVSLGDDIWGIPFSTIETAAGMTKPTREERPIERSADAQSPVDASLFFSYAHEDDLYLGGAMLQFADALRESYSFLFGGEIEIFTDRDGLPWGSAWERRIEAALTDTQFLLAMVTPRYLRSQACRNEFEQFLSTASTSREQLVLSLLWTPLPVQAGPDPVRDHIDAHQWKTAGDLAALAPATPAYRAATEQLATALHDVVVRRELSAPSGSDEADLTEAMADFERVRPELDEAVSRFGAALGEVVAVFDAHGELDPTPAAMQRLGNDLARPVEHVNEATADFTRLWATVSQVFSEVLAIARFVSGDDQTSELRRWMLELRVSLDVPGLDEVEQLVPFLGRFSRYLRPTSRALSEAIRVVRTLQSSVRDWSAELG